MNKSILFWASRPIHKIIILSAILAWLLGACNSSTTKNETIKSNNHSQIFNLDTMTLKNGQTYYQCPMDLEIISEKGGPCPKCGMDLVNRTKQ